MTDEIAASAEPAEDKPLEVLAEKERAMDEPEAKSAKSAESAEAVEEPEDAASRLRAFEDKHFGAEAVRFEGKIERGIGSKFSLMDEAKKAEHAALERLVEAEQKLLKMTAAMTEAKTEFTAALEAADAHAAE